MAFVCSLCSHRQFISQQALDAHTQSNPKAHWRVICTKCMGRFPTLAALNSHLKAAHNNLQPVSHAESTPVKAPEEEITQPAAQPVVQAITQPIVQAAVQAAVQPIAQPTVQSVQPNTQSTVQSSCSCGARVFVSAIALHFKYSANHPNCIICGEGFETKKTLDSHILASHPDHSCRPCQSVFASQTQRDQHYQESKAHPSCPLCHIGFEDEPCYHEHLLTVHPRSPTPSPLETSFAFDYPPPASYTVTVLPSAQIRSSSVYARTPGRSSHSSPSAHSASVFQESRPQSPNSDTGESYRDDREATPPSFSRASSEPPPTLPHIRTTELFPQPQVETEVPMFSAATDRATIITQASAPTSSVKTSQSVSYAISDTTPDLTNDSSYSVISPDSHQSEEVVSPVTATDLAPAVPPQATRSPTPSVRSVRDSVNATVSRPPSRRQSTPRVRHASLLPPSVPITPLEPVANASIAVAAPVTPRGNPSSAGKTSSVSSESSVSHSSRSKSSRTKVTNAVSGIPSGSNSGAKARYDPKNCSTTLSINSRAAERELNWHCRICLKDPSEPTVTMCGHLFCHGCIIQELARGLACPVCKKVMLLRLQLGATEKVIL